MRRILPIALVFSLGGCFWQQPGAGPDRTAFNDLEDQLSVATAPGIEELWSVQLDEGPASDPVTSNAGVHVADTRSVYGLAPASGTELWQYSVAAPLAMQQPIARDDDVIVSRWDAEAVVDETDPNPVPSDASFVLDAASGAVESQLSESVAVAYRGSRTLFWDLSFVRFGMSGQFPFWYESIDVREGGSAVCCDFAFGLADANDPPPPAPNLTLGSTQVLHAGYGINDLANPPSNPGNGIRGYTIGNSTGCVGVYVCPNWVIPLPGTTTTAPVLNGDETRAYVGTDSGRVVAVDLTTNTLAWELQSGSAVTAAPALANGRVYVPLASGDLTVIDAATGEVLGGYSTGASIDAQPAVGGDVVYTGSADGSVHAFDATCSAAPCPALWSDSTGSAITGAPAVSDGRLYVGTADGHLVAYGLP